MQRRDENYNIFLPEGWPRQNFDTMSHHTHFMQRRLPIENNQITIANMPLNFVATLQMQIRRLGMKSQIDSFTWKGKRKTYAYYITESLKTFDQNSSWIGPTGNNTFEKWCSNQDLEKLMFVSGQDVIRILQKMLSEN